MKQNQTKSLRAIQPMLEVEWIVGPSRIRKHDPVFSIYVKTERIHP
jgi:hypothetical protein